MNADGGGSSEDPALLCPPDDRRRRHDRPLRHFSPDGKVIVFGHEPGGGTQPRYVLVAGNYQAGITVVDFSDPANANEVAYADPLPLVPEFDGGDWSTYWYDRLIYESDITRGLTISRLDDPAIGARGIRTSRSRRRRPSAAARRPSLLFQLDPA